MRSALERIMAHVSPIDSGCWQWQGGTDGKGYGRVWFNGAVRSAHRVLFVMTNGPITNGFQLDHLCRNHSCVNPAHLEAVDCRTNIMRGNGIASTNAKKIQCVNGHSLSDYNAYLHNSHRLCRICRNAASRRYRHKLRKQQIQNRSKTP